MSSMAAFTPRYIPKRRAKLGGAHAVVKGDGDVAWAMALADCEKGTPQPIYQGGKIEASSSPPPAGS